LKEFFPKEQESRSNRCTPATTFAPHAELTLHLYHLKNPDIAPFSYVADTKLLCLLYSKVFDAYRQYSGNADGTLKFWVRGSHSKLYYLWHPPGTEISDQRLVAAVRDTLVEYADRHIFCMAGRAGHCTGTDIFG